MNLKENDFKIGLFHNEAFVDIPGCNSKDKWCDYDKFLTLFSPNVTSCDFSKICENENSELNDNQRSPSDSVQYSIIRENAGEDDRY